jgi:hypothetical protein
MLCLPIFSLFFFSTNINTKEENAPSTYLVQAKQ